MLVCDVSALGRHGQTGGEVLRVEGDELSGWSDDLRFAFGLLDLSACNVTRVWNEGSGVKRGVRGETRGQRWTRAFRCNCRFFRFKYALRITGWVRKDVIRFWKNCTLYWKECFVIFFIGMSYGHVSFEWCTSKMWIQSKTYYRREIKRETSSSPFAKDWMMA